MSSAYGRILTIDDEPVLRESIRVYLEDSGFEVYEAENGEEGLAKFRECQPDLVLSDIQMPGISGLDVLETIAKESPDTPVIMVSGAGGMDDAIEALRLGAWDYIVKPITDMTVLEHSVCKALERARLVVENKAYRKELEQTNTQLRLSLRELEEDQKAGRHVQRQILPEEKTQYGNYVFSHKILPSLYLSGDFVDYFSLSEHRIAFYVADVSGHGASSAFVTVFLKSLMSQCLSRDTLDDSSIMGYPDKVMKLVSDEILKIKLGKYLTMVYGVIDTQQNTMTYAIGGHYPSPVLAVDGSAKFLGGKGFAVGIYEKASYQSHTVELPEDFNLIFFSDGIMEILVGDDLDSQEKKLLSKTGEPYRDLLDLLEKCDVELNRSLPDDITLFTIQRVSNG